MKEPAAAFRDSLLTYCLIWAVVAVGCFQVLPRMEVTTAAELEPWLEPSYLAGLGGSLLAALGSMLSASAEEVRSPGGKQYRHCLAWWLGAVGFIGVLFPLGVSGFVFLNAARGTDWFQELFGRG
ncbi:MAG: hypothetical protein Q6K80_12015 [Thermostichus sp. DG_1_6_bins_120]